jgi:alanine-glyoxylate transaminase / (R)-3-amino-2-methylpropionate-pyruvate transaminase
MRVVTARFGFSNLKGSFPAVNHKPAPYSGPSYEQVTKDRQGYMPSFYFHYYQKPLLIVEGHMQYLYDHQGNRYIDLISGISTVSCGHSHPAITKVIAEQSAKLTHTSPIYYSEWQGEYSRMLCEQLGEGFDSVYLCNSGGEANDFAIYLARLFTGQYKFYSLKNAYHGLVGSSSNTTSVGTWNTAFRGGFEFERLGWPSTYRGVLAQNSNGDALFNEAQETLNATSANGKVAGFIFEPIQGVGGLTPVPTDYIQKTAELVRNTYGGLVIADEVQTGFGRVGTSYWGHKWKGVKPDIVTMAKGIGNGMPMGAVVTRKEIMEKIKQVYFNTFGGGHIQCRVGMQVLKTIKEEKLAENSEKVGDYLLKEFTKLSEKHEIIGNVRGKGLMIGVEVVKDNQSKSPGKEETNQLMDLTKERGLLFGKGGVHGNVFRMQPPLCLSLEDAKYVVQATEDAILSLKK